MTQSKSSPPGPLATQGEEAPADDKPRLQTALQLGMGWFPEKGGGLDRYYFDLLGALPTVGVRPIGLVAGTANVLADSAGVVRPFAGTDDSLLARWKGIRRQVQIALADHSPDVVAAHFALYAFPVWHRLRHLPRVMHFHGPWAAECRVEGSGALATVARRQLEARVYRAADRLIVLSAAFQAVLIDEYGVQPSRIRVVPGGLETARFATDLSRPQARTRLGWPGDRPIVLAVRRLVARMGLNNLIEAADEVRRNVPDVLILIAGRGRLQADLQRQIESRGLGDHVRLLGFLPDKDLPTAYRAADLTVVPTVALEGFGLIAAESLAAGTPALVTPVGGLPEVVRGLSEALVTRSIDAAVIAQSLTAALKDAANLPTPEACQQHAARFDWAIVASKVREVYEEALRLKG